MNLRDNELVEMSFVNSSTLKSNDTHPELEIFNYRYGIIENKDILDPDIDFFREKLNSTRQYFTEAFYWSILV